MDKPLSDTNPPTLPESETRTETGQSDSGQTAAPGQETQAAQSGGKQAAAHQSQTGRPGGEQTPKPTQKPERKKRYGENLRHLLDQQESDEVVVSDSLSNKMGAMFDRFQSRPTKKKEEKIPTKELLLQFAHKVLQGIIKHRKAVAWAVVGIIGLIVAVYTTPLISLQVERSAGFVAFEEENYPEAQRTLVKYLNKRPHDHQAMYYAAQAALYVGDLRYAHDTFSRLYDTGAALSTNDLPYFYALVNLDQPREALQALERWLASAPNALAGRFLRGVLLVGQPEAKRKMREDFLYVDDLIQRSNNPDEPNKILFLHNYFQKSGKFSAVLSPPLAQIDTTETPVANALRFNPGADGFIGEYNLSDGAPFLLDKLSPMAIINLYFAYGLMAGGDTQEAEVELKELQQEAPKSPSLQQALAFLALYRGKYSDAAEIFSALSQQIGDDSQTLNNLAIAFWSAGGKEVDEITSIYDNILKQGNRDRVASNNGAFLEILTGNHTAAASRLGNVGSDRSFQYTLNLGLIELWRNQPKRMIGLFSSISEKDFPNINYYLAAALEKSDDSRGAIITYRQIEKDSPNNNQAAFLRRIRLMFQRGDWRLAYSDLATFLRKNANNAEAWYYRGLLALQLGEENTLIAAKTNLAGLSPEDRHYLNALRGAEFRRIGENRRAATAFRTAMEGALNGWTKTDYAAAWGEMVVTESPQEVVDTLLPMLEANIKPEFTPELAAVLSRALMSSRPDLAREILESAILVPRSAMTAKNAALVFVRLGEAERGVELLQAAYRWLPTDEQLLRTLITVQTAAKDIDGVAQSETALAHLLLVKRGDPPVSDIEYKVFLPQARAIIKKVQDYINGEIDAEEVLAEYQNQLGLEENQITPALLLYSQATFYMYLDRLPEALESFRAALSKKFSAPKWWVQAMLFYAEAYTQARQYQGALDVLAQLIEAEGETPLYARLVADNLTKLGRDAEALQHLLDAVKRYPDDGLLHLEIARTYYDKNELETALQAAELMIRVAPDFLPGYEMLIEIYVALQQPDLARAYARVKTELEDASR